MAVPQDCLTEGGTGTHDQATDVQPRQIGQSLLKLVHQPKHPTAIASNQLPGGGRPDATTGAFEQRGVEEAFERFDMRGDGGLADALVLCCGMHRAVLHDGEIDREGV